MNLSSMRLLSLVLLVATLGFSQQSFQPLVLATPGTPSRVLWGLTSGTNSSLIRSDDLGSTWVPVYIAEAGMPQPAVNFFAIDRNSDSTLFLSTTADAGGFLKSVDNGKTWRSAVQGLPDSPNPGAVQLTRGPAPALYLTVGNQLYKSSDKAESWTLLGTLPTTGLFQVSDQNPLKMYMVGSATLNVYASSDEGHSWKQAGAPPIPPGLPIIVNGLGIPYPDPNTVFVDVSTVTLYSGVYRSTDSGVTFANDQKNGLTSLRRLDNGTPGPLYATGAVSGFERSTDGTTWKDVSKIGNATYYFTAADPKARLTIYGGSNANTNLYRSTDGGDSWNPTAATITPSIAKPSALIRITVEQGAAFSERLSILAAEDEKWALPYTIGAPDAPWFSMSNLSGTSPNVSDLAISSKDLAPGVYNGSFKISSPQSFNKSVTVPVQLAVLPVGSGGGSRYTITTLTGKDSSTVTQTSGHAADLAIGKPGPVVLDSSGKLLFATAERLWQISGSEAAVLAGTNTAGDSGDGASALLAQINAPTAIAFDTLSNIYLSEPNFASRKIRKISNGNISTLVDGLKNSFFGSNGLALDTVDRITVINSNTLSRFDGNNVVAVSTSFAGAAPFSKFSSNTAAILNDGKNNLFVSDNEQNVIFKVTPLGVVTVYAGTGRAGFSGDNGPAVSAQLNGPQGLALDSEGTLYVVDAGNYRIRAIYTNGIIETVAGTGVYGFEGDGKSANFGSFYFNNSSLLGVPGIAADKQGNLYVADTYNYRIRKLTPRGGSAPQVAGLLHGASGDPRLSPGSLFSIYCNFTLTGQDSAGAPPWPNALNGVTVTINGVLAPLYSMNANQINGQIPYETQTGPATAVITVNGSAPGLARFSVIPANPGILVFDGTRAVAVNADGQVNTASAPAAGDDIELLYLSGIGLPDQPVSTGAAAPSAEPLARAQYPYSITLDGQPVEVLYLGLAPGYPALAQANFRVPNLPPKDYALVVTINGIPSNSTLFTIGPH